MVKEELNTLLKKITNSTSYVQVFENISTWKEEYKRYVKLIHPDVCDDPRCSEALIKLHNYKDKLDQGSKIFDEACTITYFHNSCLIEGAADLLRRNVANYNIIKNFQDEASLHFHRYLPGQLFFEEPTRVRLEYDRHAIPLSEAGTLDIKHVNWILSRVLELACWFHQKGISHSGITPDSIFIVPEDHGIICTSFYHMQPLHGRLRTISGKHSAFYPADVTTTKVAGPHIDITLCKKIAIYLLGDQSGSGVKLRGLLPDIYLDFLLRFDSEAIVAYTYFRSILEKHFNVNQFHTLIL